jgi:REP-associated tyrosine transposase
MGGMGRPIRLIDNESGVMAITTRTMQGRFLMRPSKRVNNIILGVLGRAQGLYEVELHAFVFLSNHLHLMMRALSVFQMSDFVGYLKGNLARELGREHGWTERFWGRRFHSQSIGDSEASQASWFRYILANGCKEGLVGSPVEWPGASSAPALYRGASTLEGIWFDRSREDYGRRRGENEVEFPTKQIVSLTPPPFLANRSPEERQQYVIQAVKALEEETATRYRKQKSRPLGVKEIRRQKPHHKPEKFESSPSSVFHVATLKDFWPMFYARLQKVVAYYLAASRLKHGELNVEFPADCHKPSLPRGRAGPLIR